MNEAELFAYVNHIIEFDEASFPDIRSWKLLLSVIPINTNITPRNEAQTLHIVQPIELGVGRRVIYRLIEAHPHFLEETPQEQLSTGHYFIFYSL